MGLRVVVKKKPTKEKYSSVTVACKRCGCITNLLCWWGVPKEFRCYACHTIESITVDKNQIVKREMICAWNPLG